MTVINKILIVLCPFALLTILCYMIFSQEQIKKQQATIQASITTQQQLVNGIVRSQGEMVSQDALNKFATANDLNMKAIQDNLSKLGASISSVNVITTNSSGQVYNNIGSTSTGISNPKPSNSLMVSCPMGGSVACPNTDPFGYQTKQQNLDLFEVFGKTKVKIGSVSFESWSPKPWGEAILPRQYSVATIVGLDENQRQTYYNKFSVKVDGKSYELPITSAQNEEVNTPPNKFSWWNPKLFITTGGGINLTTLPVNGTFNAGITGQVMSWGKFKNSPIISVLDVGVGYVSNGNKFAGILNLVSFNVGQILNTKLISNTYVGPSLQLATDGNLFLGLNLSLGL
jgi:hypothetical protein